MHGNVPNSVLLLASFWAAGRSGTGRSVACLRQAGLEIVGVLVNGGEEDEQTEEILRVFGRVRMLGHIPWLKQEKISPGGLTTLYVSLFFGEKSE